MSSNIVLGLLFLLPFVVLPLGVSQFETPKIFVAECMVQLLFLIQLFSKDFKLQHYDRRLLVIAGGLFFISVLDFFLYPSNVAFFGNVFRLQGIYLFWHFLLLGVLSSQVKLRALKKPFFIILLGVELLLAYLFGQSIVGRFYGSLGEAHSLAAFALFIFPFALFSPIKTEGHKKTLFSFFALFLAFVLILLSGSRSGMIGLFIECLFLLLSYKTNIRNAFIVGSLLFFATFLLPFVTIQEKFENRAEVWTTAFSAGMEKPITGWGIGNVETAFKEVSPHVPNLIRYQYVDSSHNFFLDTFVQLGTLGVVLIGTLLFLAVKVFIKERNKRNLMILLGVMSVMSFNPVSVTILIALWWVVGQGFGDIAGGTWRVARGGK